ncbi:MAG: hypothetical protein ACK42A_11265 [Pyrinomonadaceae bacterium]|jgi:hypothetical protein
MIKKNNIARSLKVAIFFAAILVCSGFVSETMAQRDPFAKPAWARQKETRPGVPGSGQNKSVTDLGVPPIEQRIDYYKRLREEAAANGMPLPKVTSVLTLSELAVTGIFKTPRGYAAMVEATPIKLSYTIYPGDRFFDGQLVAVEENRLVFRKVTKMSNGKFVASVENKPLRKYTEREMIQGTAPAGSETAGGQQTAEAQAPAAGDAPKKPAVIISPLVEMEKMAAAPPKSESAKAGNKKGVKVAKSNNK